MGTLLCTQSPSVDHRPDGKARLIVKTGCVVCVLPKSISNDNHAILFPATLHCTIAWLVNGTHAAPLDIKSRKKQPFTRVATETQSGRLTAETATGGLLFFPGPHPSMSPIAPGTVATVCPGPDKRVVRLGSEGQSQSGSLRVRRCSGECLAYQGEQIPSGPSPPRLLPPATSSRAIAIPTPPPSDPLKG